MLSTLTILVLSTVASEISNKEHIKLPMLFVIVIAFCAWAFLVFVLAYIFIMIVRRPYKRMPTGRENGLPV
jgi:hypothetical protein